MKKVKLFFTAIMVLLAADIASAQSAEVNGTVRDAETGEPVPFASVVLHGTMTGTVTADDGSYSISVPSLQDAVLEFSFIGYRTVVVPVEGKSVVDCELEVDAMALEDVIVVAYGATRREDVTGAVSSVESETIASVPVTSVDKMLAGKLAGVQITTNSAQPGAASSIRIRGTSSINSSNEPLWVIDGIPVINGDLATFDTSSSSSFTALNPNDIESITVLKDAAAASVYGSRAANGVILVTTKSGKAGKAQFDARVKYGVSWLQSDSGFRMMTAAELLGYQRDAIINAGMDPDDPTGSYYRPLSLLNGKLTNWVDHTSRLGTLQEYEISARGGNDRAKYFSSVSYHNNEGVYYGIGYEKITARVNADYKLLRNLETGVRINASYGNQESDVPLNSLYNASPVFAGLTMLPWVDPYNEDGTHNVNIPSNSNYNPRATAEYDTTTERQWHINGSMYLRWEPVKHLVIESRNSAELIYNKYNMFSSVKSNGNPNPESGRQVTWTEHLQLTTSNTINYANVFGGYHSFRALVGQEAMRYNYEGLNALGYAAQEEIPFLNSSDQSRIRAEELLSKETLLSYFGIVDYNYDNRYFLQASLRADGSSLFGKNSKWGMFWSASASWNINQEKFLRNFKPLDLLKLRFSYGVNGNNGIAAYRAYGVYGTTTYNGVTGMSPSSPANDELSWEKNATWNVGLDFAFFNRLRGSVDVYNRLTKDMLLTVKVPWTTGFNSNFRNVGSMKNTGVEVQIDGDIIYNSDFAWNVGFNLAYNENEILDLGGEDFISGGSFVRYAVGHSRYSYYVPLYYGVNPSNGEALWIAGKNDNGDPILTNQYNKAMYDYVGSPDPKVIGGFNTTFSWKGLSLSAFFEYRTGCDVLILNEQSYMNSDGAEMTLNQMASSLNYWKKPGDNGVNPKPIAGNSTNSAAAVSSRWLEDGSYIRIKDVTLSYSLPQKALDKMRIKGLRFYVSGLNLYCFNDVNWWDPDLGPVGYGAGTYPLTKSFVGGIEVSF